MVSAAVKELQSAKKQLLARISTLESEIAQIDASVAALAGLEGSGSEAADSNAAESTPVVGAGKRIISAATKAKMKKAQQARWAKINAAKAGNAPEADAKPKKKMSPLGKLKIKLGALNRYGKTAEAKKVKAQIAALEAKK